MEALKQKIVELIRIRNKYAEKRKQEKMEMVEKKIQEKTCYVRERPTSTRDGGT